MTSKSQPPITLCIINYNGERYLPDSLAAARALRPSFGDLLLVDNASSDASLEVVRRAWPDMRVVALRENRGAGGARNVGLREALCDRILFVDDDVVLAPGCPEALASALEISPDAALAMARVLYRRDPGTVQYDGAGCHFLGLMSLETADVPLASAPRAVRRIDSIVTACFLMDRSRWPGAGFDETFFMYFEDHDFGVRARVTGHSILSVPSALCYHGEGTPGVSLRSTGAYQPVRVFCTIRNRWQVLAKSYELRSLLLLGPALAGYELFQLAGVVRKRWFREWARAVLWILGHAPGLLARRRALQRERRLSDRAILTGGAIPFSLALPAGRLERAGLAVLNRMAAAYWRGVRRWL